MPVVQELVAHVDGSIQVTATVVGQIHDELGHALLLEVLEGFHHLLVGLGAEAGDAQVGCLVIKHILGINTVQGDVITSDAEGDGLFHARTQYFNGHLGAFLATQPLHDVAVLHLHASNNSVVDHSDAVTGQNAHSLTGTTGNSLDDVERILVHVELDAHAAEFTLQGLLEFFGLFGIGIGRVGIKAVEHALDGILNQLFLIDGVHIKG